MEFSAWKMRYGDLVLKKQIGSGQGGIVMLAYLKREAKSAVVTNYIRKESAPGGRPNYLLVAVKRFRGETLATGGLLLLWYIRLCSRVSYLSTSSCPSTQLRGCALKWTTFTAR